MVTECQNTSTDLGQKLDDGFCVFSKARQSNGFLQASFVHRQAVCTIHYHYHLLPYIQ